MKQPVSLTRLALAFCAAALIAAASTSTAWEVAGFGDLSKGRISGLSLSADGVLRLGPAVRFSATLDQPALWSIVPAPHGGIYASTGHQGKVFLIGSDGRPTLVWTAQQSEVFALAIGRNGVLYAGTSPNGGLYRIENGQAKEIWHSPAKYIWAIEPAPDGSLYVATGEAGRIYRLVPSEREVAATVYYETGQANVTALALAANGRLYAGTDPNGLLYEISGPNQGTILYDSSLPEIRSIVVDPAGTVYAAAMGGAVATRSATATITATSSTTGAVVATTPTVITVTEAARNTAAADTETIPKPAADQAKTASSTSSSAAGSTTAAVVEVSGVEKSAIYRIRPDRTAETLRSSKEDNVFDLLLNGDSLLFSTDDNGRIYSLRGNKTTLLFEPGSGETMRLLQSPAGLYAAMSNPARLYSFGAPGSAGGFYESQVHDASSPSRWGHLQWRGSSSGLSFRTRSGNAARPDATWSAWSDPLSKPSGALIESPSARFIQWRAEWPAGSPAALNAVTVPYLPQNGPPVIHSVSVTSILATNTVKSTGNVTAGSSAYSITVTDTGQPAPATSTTSSSQTVSRLQTTQTQIAWQADDPDSDKLVYSVYFRAEDENEWQLIRSRMFENTLLLDPDVFADGRYYFRVIASDAPSNAVEYAQQTELVSPPVLIDNTPPAVSIGQPHRREAVLDVDLDASDQTSPLRLCEYSIDAGFWQPIEASDGITDSPHERFHLHLEKLRPGEHLLVFRVYDTANNAGLARIILR